MTAARLSADLPVGLRPLSTSSKCKSNIEGVESGAFLTDNHTMDYSLACVAYVDDRK